MITIPLYIFLVLFAVVTIICFIFFGIIVYHLAHGGSLTFTSFAFTSFILCVAILVLWGVWFLLGDISWGTEAFQLSIPFYGNDEPTPFFE